jgi:hypothetical protein
VGIFVTLKKKGFAKKEHSQLSIQMNSFTGKPGSFGSVNSRMTRFWVESKLGNVGIA